MADIADMAQERIDAENNARMANINRFNTPSRSACIECDEPIPPQRQAVGGVTHCIDCQDALERRR